mmetsp:Transcript_33256/g.130920  ORF Transcript_33256/g.130920 Transcript_33256/m.130920 type:complete len:150 (-) Transcript_33256:685-1134(-)
MTAASTRYVFITANVSRMACFSSALDSLLRIFGSVVTPSTGFIISSSSRSRKVTMNFSASSNQIKNRATSADAIWDGKREQRMLISLPTEGDTRSKKKGSYSEGARIHQQVPYLAAKELERAEHFVHIHQLHFDSVVGDDYDVLVPLVY